MKVKDIRRILDVYPQLERHYGARIESFPSIEGAMTQNQLRIEGMLRIRHSVAKTVMIIPVRSIIYFRKLVDKEGKQYINLVTPGLGTRIYLDGGGMQLKMW